MAERQNSAESEANARGRMRCFANRGSNRRRAQPRLDCGVGASNRSGLFWRDVMASDNGLMDDLLARTLAQREVLNILIRLALPSEEERLLACKDAAEFFERI